MVICSHITQARACRISFLAFVFCHLHVLSVLWYGCVQGLIKFAFILIDGGSSQCARALDYSAGIGFEILVALFKIHELVRSEVRDSLLVHIVLAQ